MAPPGSLSPRRKRIRKHLSLSSASGSKWVANLGQPSTPAKKRRRGSSPPVTDIFPLTQHTTSISDEEDDFARLITDDETSLPHAETFPMISPPQRQPLTYASLPPTPISSSPARHPSPPPLQLIQPPLSQKPPEPAYEPPFSLWDYLREELLATDFDSHQELKWERVSNFLSMPLAIEKVRGASYHSIYLI